MQIPKFMRTNLKNRHTRIQDITSAFSQVSRLVFHASFAFHTFLVSKYTSRFVKVAVFKAQRNFFGPHRHTGVVRTIWISQVSKGTRQQHQEGHQKTEVLVEKWPKSKDNDQKVEISNIKWSKRKNFHREMSRL